MSDELKPAAGWSAKLAWAVVHAAFLLAGCAGQTVDESAGGEGLSDSQRIALELEQTAGFVNDPELLAYVESVGDRIVAQGSRNDIDYRFEILDTAMPNALALPDGQIFISRGVLVLINSEDELAGILAHEIAHVEEHHASARENFALVTSPIRLGTDFAGWATGLVIPGLGDAIVELGASTTGIFLAPYNREQEREADRVGQSLAAAAGYRPEGLVDLLDTMASAESLDVENAPEASWFDSHPATVERVDLTRQHAETLMPAVRPASARNRSQVLAALEGLVVGVNPGKGFFDENWFVHPDLAFVMAVPPGWEVINTAGFVGAKKPDEETFVMLALVARGSDPMEGARAASRKLGVDVASDAQLGMLNGLQAARNQARITTDDGEVEMLELTWIAHGGLIYQVMGISAPKKFEVVEDVMRRSAHSFRPLTNEERASILVIRVRVVEGVQGETIAELAERIGTPWSVESIAVVNRKPVGERLRAGELIKVGIPESYTAGPGAASSLEPLQ